MNKAEIYKFAKNYAESGTVRMHMPGHKGQTRHGLEALDLTEIHGADYLYESGGIIKRSEERMAELYGSAMTCYSTEGSSLSIKAMLGIVKANSLKVRPKIAAGRNCHRAFINGCILLDIEPVWIYPERLSGSICSSEITPRDVRRTLEAEPDIEAVYITSPDYTGRLADISGIANVCREKKVSLLVDNAHGAYLRFTEPDLHPITLGADMCADSAHKTLPCYTGASMLHISKHAPESFCACAKEEMSLFASTSPSYLIMQSLDICAAALELDFPVRIRRTCRLVGEIKEELLKKGFTLTGDEQMKITIEPGSMGYTGNELAVILRAAGIECEYSDPGCVVLMPSPCNRDPELEKLKAVLLGVERLAPLPADDAPLISIPKRAMLPREAYFRPHRKIPTDLAKGCVCARTALSCQPSIPIIVGGEIFEENIIKILKRYSILEVNVLQ